MKKILNWMNHLQLAITNPKVIISVLVFCVGFLIFKRIGWDSGLGPLMQSDSQIKLYQTLEYKERGINSHQCFSKYHDFDSDFRFYPFRYPWAYFTTEVNGQRTCVFQYPSFFAQFFSLFPIPYRAYNAVILLLYLFLSCSVVLFLRSIFAIKKVEYLGLAGLLFLVGYAVSSAIEFSESIPAHLLLLSFFYSVFRLESTAKSSIVRDFFFGFCGGVAIFLRSESVIYIGFLGLVVLYYNRSQLLLFVKKYCPLVFGLVFALVLFGYYNYNEFQEVLGVRSKVSFDDFSRLLFKERIHLVFEFFFGDTNRIGFLFYCLPIVSLVIYSVLKVNLTYLQKVMIVSAILSFFSVVFLSPYSSGGLYLGLRFTEFSYLIISIFVISLLSTVTLPRERQIILLLILLQIGFGLYHVRRNFKTIDYVKKYHDIFQEKLEKYPNAPVVHLSTFDLLLISDSFLKKPHWIANRQTEFSDLELKFLSSNVKHFQVFVYNFKPPKDDNVTQEFYENWVDTKYEINSKYYKKVSDEEIAGFRLMFWEKN
ncbi:LA_3751/LA_3752 family putative glycosyltransferase [Leptospira perdikensis]|uniref:Glycosyltransferase RgtA/B/C/D-like domain-containing protein n=1 Tax=Leptospira perdikensis TaxID=2484948 RepID=A0A4R9JEU9_9LEPT|nr:hypothetical protein [Leptospira perdikensis]TGL37140.1 hypothetical protein EHQ49_12865 [Leptospira perdikensis]